MLVEMTIMLMIMMMMIIFALASRYVKVPPNKAMIVFGRRYGQGEGLQIYTSGGKFMLPIVESWSWLDLSITSMSISIRDIVSMKGTLIDIDATAQFQIDPQEDSLKTAAVMLLNKNPDEIEYVAKKTIEGHFRGICATLTYEQIHVDRMEVSEHIIAVAVRDLKNMGLNIVSLTIRDMKKSGAIISERGREEVMKDIPERILKIEQRISDIEALLKPGDGE